MSEEQKPVYESIPRLTRDQIEECMTRNDSDELSRAVLSAALYSGERYFAERVCVKLAGHEHFNVRGNALLGFAHMARLDGLLTEQDVRPLIEAGLNDPDDYVRGHAEDAKDDIEQFLGWKF